MVETTNILSEVLDTEVAEMIKNHANKTIKKITD
jgi:hypothetical protein